MEIRNTYIEIATGSPGNRGKLIPIEELRYHLHPEVELYRSLYLLDKSACEVFEKKRSIKSYSGKFGLDRITFDLDIGTNKIDGFMDIVRYFITQLKEKGADETDMRVWFSGRGFHIEIPDYFGFEESKYLPETVKLTLKQLSNIPDSIYDKGRLIRVGYSYNKKSKLYKTPLSLWEVNNNTYEEVIALSGSVRKDYKHEPLPKKIEHIWKSLIMKRALPSVPVKIKNGSPALFNSNVTCVQKIYAGGEVVGKRHTYLLRLINSWRRLGLNKKAGLTLARSYATSLDDKEIENIADSVYKWGYKGYSCNDPVLAEYCDPLCRFYKRKDYGTEVYDANELINRLVTFVNTDFSEKSFNLNEVFPFMDSYKILPGELVILQGDTKLGKTAWVQNIISYLKRLPCLFLSLEVHDTLISRRNLQISLHKTKDEIDEMCTNPEIETVNMMKREVEHINVLTTSPEIASVKELISDLKPSIVVVDTLDAISVNYVRDQFQVLGVVVTELKQLAQKLDVIIVAISHKARGKEAFDIHGAKGNSAIEQKADKVIEIAGHRDSQRRVVKSLGSRDESNFEQAFYFDYKTFQFKGIG